MKAPSKKVRAVVLAPMSETAAQLLHQLVQDAANAAAPAPGSIVLKPAVKIKHCPEYSDALHYVAYGDDLSSTRWTRFPSTSWPQWVGREDRRDEQGRRWERVMFGIVDDFGMLVEVNL